MVNWEWLSWGDILHILNISDILDFLSILSILENIKNVENIFSIFSRILRISRILSISRISTVQNIVNIDHIENIQLIENIKNMSRTSRILRISRISKISWSESEFMHGTPLEVGFNGCRISHFWRKWSGSEVEVGFQYRCRTSHTSSAGLQRQVGCQTNYQWHCHFQWQSELVEPNGVKFNFPL